MTKLILAIVAGCCVGIGLFLFFGYPKYQDMRQRKLLFERSDYPEIAAACVKLARSSTNELMVWLPTNPAVPPILRSLSPREISGSSNYLEIDFGGMGRYSYGVLQSRTNPKQWTLDINSPEQYLSRPLTTITND